MNNLSASDLPTLAYLIGILIASYLILRSLVFPIIKRGASKTTTYIDDLFLDKKFLNRVSYVFVFVLFNFSIPVLFLTIRNSLSLSFSSLQSRSRCLLPHPRRCIRHCRALLT